MENQTKKKWYEKWWVIALVAIVGLYIIFAISNKDARQSMKEGFKQGSQQ